MIEKTNPENNIEKWSRDALKKKREINSNIQLGKLTLKEAEKVICTFAKDNSITESETIIVFSYLLQKGGSTKSCNPDEAIIMDNRKYTVRQLRIALEKNGLKDRARMLGRTLAPHILKIAINNNIPGNLAKTIARRHSIPQEDFPYYSDFYSEAEVGIERKRLIDEHLEYRRTRSVLQNKKRKRKNF
jgi:hypothetical protein